MSTMLKCKDYRKTQEKEKQRAIVGRLYIFCF